MIAMQYKITLPNHYDMEIIKQRVRKNGHKTDGFTDLLCKVYLISNLPNKKQYCPLYVWQNNSGMNQFIFDGYYDNILDSFGWQNINIAVPYNIHLTDRFYESKYVLEIENDIVNTDKMNNLTLTYPNENCLGSFLVYNPDKWKYTEFYFYQKIPKKISNQEQIYEILHISM